MIRHTSACPINKCSSSSGGIIWFYTGCFYYTYCGSYHSSWGIVRYRSEELYVLRHSCMNLMSDCQLLNHSLFIKLQLHPQPHPHHPREDCSGQPPLPPQQQPIQQPQQQLINQSPTFQHFTQPFPDFKHATPSWIT